MHPIFVQWGPLTIYYYGVLVSMAFLLGGLWALRRAKDAGEDPDTYMQATLWIALAGFIGGRLLYVIYYPEYYLEHPVRIILDRGGLVWYGGVALGSLAGVVFAKIRKLDLAKFGDILSIPAVLGLAIGRIGCFMTGCCYGRETALPWGVQFPHDHVTYPAFLHPTQLYETFLLLSAIPILLWVYRRHADLSPGVTMGTFFVTVGAIRFILEYFRGDVIYWVGNVLSASQVLSLIAIAAGILMILWSKGISLLRPRLRSL